MPYIEPLPAEIAKRLFEEDIETDVLIDLATKKIPSIRYIFTLNSLAKPWNTIVLDVPAVSSPWLPHVTDVLATKINDHYDKRIMEEILAENNLQLTETELNQIRLARLSSYATILRTIRDYSKEQTEQ
jgi:hypothetical protein